MKLRAARSWKVAAAAACVIVLTTTVPARANCQNVFSAISDTQFVYKLCDVTDLDQYRLDYPNLLVGLPNDGLMYCVPTSAVNWMAYIANHGYPGVMPGPGNWQLGPPQSFNVYNAAGTAILNMGSMMGTHPINGTSGGPAATAMQAWLDQAYPGAFNVDLWVAVGDYAPRFTEIALLAWNGYAMIMPGVGWYDNPAPGMWVRDGGHMVSLAEAMASGASWKIGMRDPDPYEGVGTTQAPFTTDEYYVTPVVGYFDGFNFRTQDRILGYGSGMLDNYIAIEPLWGLSTQQQVITIIHPIQFFQHGDVISGDVIKEYIAADGRTIIDMAIHPTLTRHPYLVEDSDTVWSLDVVTGQSNEFARVPGARRLVFGGGDQSLYVLARVAPLPPRTTPGSQIVGLDRQGRWRGTAPLTADIEAIAFDGARNQLVAVSMSSREIIRLSHDLRVVSTAPLPIPPCDPLAKVSASIGPDGSLWVHCDPNPVAHRIREAAGGGAEVIEVPLQGTREAIGLSVDRRGHPFASAGGRIVEFEPDGTQVFGGWFDGQPGGSVLRIDRPTTNFDPTRMTGPAYRNVPRFSPPRR